MKSSTVVFEDATLAYNRWTQGIASRQHATTQTTLPGLLNGDNNATRRNKVTPFKPLHPHLESTPKIVGNIILSLQQLEHCFKLGLNSNLRQKPQNRAALIKLIKLTRQHRIFCKEYRKEIDKIS